MGEIMRGLLQAIYIVLVIFTLALATIVMTADYEPFLTGGLVPPLPEVRHVDYC